MKIIISNTPPKPEDYDLTSDRAEWLSKHIPELESWEQKDKRPLDVSGAAACLVAGLIAGGVAGGVVGGVGGVVGRNSTLVRILAGSVLGAIFAPIVCLVTMPCGVGGLLVLTGTWSVGALGFLLGKGTRHFHSTYDFS